MKTLPEGWTDRHTQVARLALQCMTEEARMRVTMFTLQGKKILATKFTKDAEDAEAAVRLLTEILEST